MLWTIIVILLVLHDGGTPRLLAPTLLSQASRRRGVVSDD
jgi:hypothetical protein